jgi:hypothetical protein
VSVEVGGVPDGWDDDEELLAALRQALRGQVAPPAGSAPSGPDPQAGTAAQAVPPEFIEAGKAAYTWRTIDAELAELTYDSAQESLAVAGQRAEDASARTLTFSSAHLTIELEATGDALLGQLVPVQTGLVEIQPGPEKGAQADVDTMGCFTIRPIPAGPFRLRCQSDAGVVVLTEWLSL